MGCVSLPACCYSLHVPMWTWCLTVTRLPAFSGWVMGFFLGFLLLIWMWQDSVSTKQKMGIFVGVVCNMAVTIMRQQMV